MKILIISPHTDDGELGCGGSIAKLSKDNEVYYVALINAYQSVPIGLPGNTLEFEAKQATSILGIKQDNFMVLDFDVRRTHEQRQRLLDELLNIRDAMKPDLIFTPSVNDIHQDHQTVSQEAIRAFKHSSILGYELPWNNYTFNPQCYIKLEQTHIDLKLLALECYESQKDKPYMKPEYIESLASTRGLQINCKYAEAFEVIRWIM